MKEKSRRAKLGERCFIFAIYSYHPILFLIHQIDFPLVKSVLPMK